MDLKKRNPKDKLDVYAAVPPMEVIRLILASYRHETEEMSSTDLDVAYLQAHKWANFKKAMERLMPMKSDPGSMQ